MEIFTHLYVIIHPYCRRENDHVMSVHNEVIMHLKIDFTSPSETGGWR